MDSKIQIRQTAHTKYLLTKLKVGVKKLARVR
jgi:hypothetical protein